MISDFGSVNIMCVLWRCLILKPSRGLCPYPVLVTEFRKKINCLQSGACTISDHLLVLLLRILKMKQVHITFYEIDFRRGTLYDTTV